MCGLDFDEIGAFIGVTCQCLISIATTIILPIVFSQVGCSSFNRIQIWGIIQGLPTLILYPTLALMFFIQRRYYPNIYREAAYHYVPSLRKDPEPIVDNNNNIITTSSSQLCLFNHNNSSLPGLQPPRCIAQRPPSRPIIQPQYYASSVVMPWTCPRSGGFAPHRVEQITAYLTLNVSQKHIIDDPEEPTTNDKLITSSRPMGPHCTRQLHGVFSSQDHINAHKFDNMVQYIMGIFTIICVIIYFGLLIYGTVIYSLNTQFCTLENPSANQFVLSMIILYWITPLWVPLLMLIIRIYERYWSYY